MATSGNSPSDSDEARLFDIPFGPSVSNLFQRTLWDPPVEINYPEINGRRLLGLRGPHELVRQSLTPLLAFVVDTRLPGTVRFSGRQFEPGTTVGEALWPDGPPAWAQDLEALDDPLPEEALKRQPKVEALRQAVPIHLINRGRRREIEGKLDERYHSSAEIQKAIGKAAADALVVAPWAEELLEEDEEQNGLWLRLDRLAAYLTDSVEERLLDGKGRTVEAGRINEGAPRAVDLDGLDWEGLTTEEAAAVYLRASPSVDPEDPWTLLLAAETRRWTEEIERRAKLSPAQEKVWRMHREGLRHADIAKKIGRAEGTVKSHLHRAREKLRKVLPKSM